MSGRLTEGKRWGTLRAESHEPSVLTKEGVMAHERAWGLAEKQRTVQTCWYPREGSVAPEKEPR